MQPFKCCLSAGSITSEIFFCMFMLACNLKLFLMRVTGCGELKLFKKGFIVVRPLLLNAIFIAVFSIKEFNRKVLLITIFTN